MDTALRPVHANKELTFRLRGGGGFPLALDLGAEGGVVLKEGLHFVVHLAAREGDVGAVVHIEERPAEIGKAAILEFCGGVAELQHIEAVAVPEFEYLMALRYES